MNMIFDFWINQTKERIYTHEEEVAMETIWNYAYDRVFLLIDEIEAEEAADNKPKAIVIHLMKRPYAIQPHGYSDNLHNKIVECFNDNDAALLWKSVENALIGLLN